MDKSLGSLAGALFAWKAGVLAVIILSAVFICRSFCRFICPLGAVYSLFAPVALLGVAVDDNACTNCGRCVKACKMDIKKVGDMECVQCGECIQECSLGAIRWKNPFSR